tara:strand:- start:1798 stop:2595 length:798 start_codon:yes stop_codon:yes gene_type:complete
MSYYADSNGTKIFYQIVGSGQPLVLLMGFGADGNLWEKHFQEYKKHFKCIIIDNRGVGKSDQPKGPYTTKMMASDTLAVMKHAGIDKANIAGISMGGAIAQELAINHPEKVIRLVLISTWPSFNNYAKTVYENLKKLRVTSKRNEFMKLLQLWIFAPPYFENNLQGLIEDQQAALNDKNPQTRYGFEGQLDACIHHNTISRLVRINVPTLITVGQMDIFTPPVFSEILRDGINKSEYVIFPTGGHVHHWEDLERFNKITSTFLKK